MEFIKPKISIVVPVYSVEKYIHKCIDSILSQTFDDFECILVDDCTPDNSGKICDEYAEKDQRIKVIHKSQNEGLPQARKTGFENSNGDYILYVDSDDWIESNMVEKMYSLAILNDYDMVCCDVYCYNKLNVFQHKKMPSISVDSILNIKATVLDFDIGGFVINKLIKKNIYAKINFPEFSNGEDKYITAQTLFYSSKIGYVSTALYHYRYNPLSLVNNPKLEWKRYLERRYNYMEIFSFLKEKYGGNLNIFEPELGRRMRWLKEKNPRSFKNITKKMLRLVIPIGIWEQLKKYHNSK